MSANGHARRLDAVARKLPPVRPSIDELGAEYDRLIGLYEARQAGEPSAVIAPKWPISRMDRWVNELVDEGLE